MKRKKRSSKKSRSVWRKGLFLLSLVLVSFLVYRTYLNTVPALKIPSRITSKPSRPVPPVRPRLSESVPIQAPIPRGELPHRSSLWTSKPKLVFIIDDIGWHRKNLALFKQLKNYVTYAILPHIQQTAFYSRLSHETKAEVILHMPLQSEAGKFASPGLITPDMTKEEIIKTVNWDLDSVSGRVGANNHMGSLVTADRRIMKIILKEINKRGLFFLDSHTTANIVSDEIGKEIGMPVLERNIFLDNIDEPEAIRAEISKMKDIAKKDGFCIAIGHDRHNTLEVIREEIPFLIQDGFQIVSLSEVVEHTTK